VKTSRCTDRQIIAVLKEAGGWTPVPEPCRTHGISNATFYQVAIQVRRDGRLADVPDEGAGG